MNYRNDYVIQIVICKVSLVYACKVKERINNGKMAQ